MKAKDLIAALQRFNPDDEVAVEVEASTGKYFDECTDSVYMGVDKVQFENTDRFGVKIVLEP